MIHLPKMKKMSEWEGDALVLVAMALFGSYALFLLLFPKIPTLTFLFTFQVIGVISFYIACRSVGFSKPKRSQLLFFIALAVVAVSHDFFYFLALRETSVANATVAHQSVSIFLLFLAPLLLHEKTHRDEWLALIPALLGIIVLYSHDVSFGAGKNFIGIGYGLIAGLFYALLIILYNHIPKRGVTIRVLNFWRYLIGTIILLPFAPYMGLGSINSKNILSLLGFGLLFAVLASGIHNLGMSRTRALHASIIGKTEPIFAIIYAFFILDQKPSIEAIVGGILIISSSIWLALRSNGEL